MAAIVSPFLGALVGGAVYYTISQTMINTTSNIRSDLHHQSQLLTYHSTAPSSSFSTPPPPAPSTYLSSQQTSDQPLPELIKSKWNSALTSLVHSAEKGIDTEVLVRSSIEAAKGISRAVGDLSDRLGGVASGNGAATAEVISEPVGPKGGPVEVKPVEVVETKVGDKEGLMGVKAGMGGAGVRLV